MVHALSFFLVYGTENNKNIIFDFFPTSSAFYYLKHLVALTPLVTVPFYVIDLADLLDKNGFLCVYGSVVNDSGSIESASSGTKTTVRLILATCILLLSEISPSITVIFKLSGLVAGPLLCFIFPVLRL